MRKKHGLILATLLSIIMVFPVSAETEIITGNRISKHGDFDYELWRDTGEATMILNEGGLFECEWDKNSTSNVLFRTGKKFDKTKKHDEIGVMSLEYGCDYQPDGNSYLCVYGWSVEPLVEFYVVDSWGSWRPPGSTSKGTVEIDGGTYDIYETTRVNQPSIEGTKTFQQYWSVRTKKNTSGTISISEHIKAWEEMGMSLGNLYEVALCVEGYKSSGKANVYSNMLTFGDTTIGFVSELPQNTEETEEPVLEQVNTEPVEETEPASAETVEAAESANTDIPVEENIDETTNPNNNNEPVVNESPDTLNPFIIIILGVAVVAAAVSFILLNKKSKKK